MYTIDDYLTKLRQLLKIPTSLTPATQGLSFIEIRCYCDFEGHGRASERWEEHWELSLPQIPHHWRNNNGQLIKGKYASGYQRFHSKTLIDAVRNAVEFMEDYNGCVVD